jgi:hypothetical protein
MIDVQKETERLTKRFIEQLEAIGAQMSAETKAVSWSMAAEVIAAGLQAIAVGSLTCEQFSTSLAVPVTKAPPAPRQVFQPRVYGPKVRIKAPKPTERAERYTALLVSRRGEWSRRDGKIRYTVCDTKVTHSVSKAFYKMRRVDSGVETWIKFASIVSDWKHYA